MRSGDRRPTMFVLPASYELGCDLPHPRALGLSLLQNGAVGLRIFPERGSLTQDSFAGCVPPFLPTGLVDLRAPRRWIAIIRGRRATFRTD